MNDEYDPTKPFVPSEPDDDLDWEDEEGSPKLLWGRVLALAGVLLLIFLLGRATAPDDAAAELEEVKAQLAGARDQIAELEDATAAPPTSPAPTITNTDEETEDPPEDDPEETEGEIKSYTVQDGDNFTTIAEDEFDESNPAIVDCLIDANGGEETVVPGEEINIPETCGDA